MDKDSALTDTPVGYEKLTEQDIEKKLNLEQEVRKIVAKIDENDCHPTKCSNQLRRIFDIFYDKDTKRTHQIAVGDALAGVQFADCIYKLMKTKKEMGYFPSGLNRTKNKQMAYTTYDIFDNAWNYSDASKLFNNRLMETGIVEILLDNLVKYPNRNPLEKNQNEFYIIRASLAIITNLALRPENKALFSKYKPNSEATQHEDTSETATCDKSYSKHDIIKIIKEFSSSKNKTLRMFALSCLAGVAEKSDIDKITKDFNIVGTMVNWMSCAVEAGEANAMKEGYTATSICDVIDKLAVNGNIEVFLTKTGLLPALYRMMESNDTKQMISASKCLWRLAFDELGKKKITTEVFDSMDESKNIPTTLDRLFMETTNEKVFKNVEGALFTLYGKEHLEQLMSEQIPKVLEGCETGKKKQKKKSGPFIFISYCWNEQDIAVQIRDKLKESKYEVWIDVDNMSGSILDKMAYAVENATLTLMCASEGYKQSHNCKLEAEYLDKLHKDYIPVMVTNTKKFDGWLELLLGSRKYVVHPDIEKFPELSTEITQKMNDIKDKKD